MLNTNFITIKVFQKESQKYLLLYNLAEYFLLYTMLQLYKKYFTSYNIILSNINYKVLVKLNQKEKLSNYKKNANYKLIDKF